MRNLLCDCHGYCTSDHDDIKDDKEAENLVDWKPDVEPPINSAAPCPFLKIEHCCCSRSWPSYWWQWWQWCNKNKHIKQVWRWWLHRTAGPRQGSGSPRPGPPRSEEKDWKTLITNYRQTIIHRKHISICWGDIIHKWKGRKVSVWHNGTEDKRAETNLTFFKLDLDINLPINPRFAWLDKVQWNEQWARHNQIQLKKSFAILTWTCQNVSLAWLAEFETKDQIGQNLSISAKLILSLQMEQRDLFRQSLHGKG